VHAMCAQLELLNHSMLKVGSITGCHFVCPCAVHYRGVLVS